jgi:pyruvate/2-oxoglutarate dehydrogenase complex dihydrolipoamide dehydrogenase (E3) component
VDEYDLIVIGGGAGGMGAARAAVRRGARTLLVQSGPLGGECTFTGCVPSKALIEAAARGATFSEAKAAVRQAIETIAATETDEVFAREGIEVVHGRATFHSAHELDGDGRHLRAARIIVATGSRPAIPPIDGLDGVDVLTNETVFDLDDLPGSLAVLGGGAIGCELAQAFARLGATVTVVEARDRLLPNEEPDASAVITEVLAAERIEVRVGEKVSRAEALNSKGAVKLHLQSGATVSADRLLVAVGRQASTEGLGLDRAGIATDHGFIVTDDHLATTAPNVWAVGDVAGKLQFTHAAYEMGRVAAANALAPGWRPRQRFDPSSIPSVVYTSPEVARVGMTESEAATHRARVAWLPMTEVDRAVAAGQTKGFVKLLAGPRPILRDVGGGRILGATVVAPRGGELIHEAVLAMRTDMFTGRLAQAVHAYPTWSMAIQKAAAQFFMEIEGRRARPAQKSS